MKKMVITRNIEPHYREQIQALIPDWELFAGKDKHIWQDHVKDAEIIAGWKNGLRRILPHPRFQPKVASNLECWR